MKITSQTSDELVLKDGGVFRFVFGGGFMLFGLVFAYMMYMSGTHGTELLIPVAPFLIGLLSFLFIPSLIINFNKTTGQITYQKKRVAGTRITLYAISDVNRLEARKQWQIQRTQNANQRGVSVGAMNERLVLIVQSVLVLKDGRELPLDVATGTSAQSTGSSLAIAGNEVSVAKQVADFLNVPFQEIEPPRVEGAPMSL
jgi:hypothetical protein